ncbi:MAG: helix-turn-helix transcriptional regulator [Alphaproteobacteria bacterium]|nr:helix-turn-helix transcriptional regulator [Alphaproteobacteria bacterium]
MRQEVVEFFKEINRGKLRGSQAKMARDLHTSTATTNRYYSGDQIPSLQTIKDMAQTYNKSEKEIKRVFGVDEPQTTVQNNYQNQNCNISQFCKDTETELLKVRLETIDTKIESLSAKMDLIIQMFKGGK